MVSVPELVPGYMLELGGRLCAPRPGTRGVAYMAWQPRWCSFLFLNVQKLGCHRGLVPGPFARPPLRRQA